MYFYFGRKKVRLREEHKQKQTQNKKHTPIK